MKKRLLCALMIVCLLLPCGAPAVDQAGDDRERDRGQHDGAGRLAAVRREGAQPVHRSR